MKKITIIFLLVPFLLFGQKDFQFSGDFTISGIDTLLVDSITGLGDSNYKLIGYSGSLDSNYIVHSARGKIVIYNDTVPISNLFENLNYADTLYCSRLDVDTNNLGQLIIPLRINRISHYSTPTTDNSYPVSFGETASMITVGVGKDYSTIQEAIAASVNGDTILVFDGKYNSNSTYINVNKEVYIKNVGISSVENQNASYCFLINAASKLDGIYVINNDSQYAYFTNNKKFEADNMYVDNGARIMFGATSSDSLVLSNSYYSYNSASTNRGAYIFTSKVNIEGVTFDFAFNAATQFQNASNIDLTVKYCDFKGDYIPIYSTTTLDTVRYVGNRHDNTKQTFFFSDTTLYYNNLLFKSNIGTLGNVIDEVKAHVSYNVVMNNDIVHNSALNMIESYNQNIHYVNNISNTIGTGGTIFIRSDSSIDCTISNNEIYVNGSGGNMFIGDRFDTDNSMNVLIEKNYLEYSEGANVHGFQVYDQDSCLIRYNYSVNVDLPYIFKGDSTDMRNSAIYCNVAKNGRIVLKGVKRSKVYNNTIYNDSLTTCINLLYNEEYVCDSIDILNNIFVTNNVNNLNGAIKVDQSDIYFTSNYNVIESATNIGLIATTSYNWFQWLSTGYDLMSKNENPLLNSGTQLWPTFESPAIGNGFSLDSRYDDLLGINSSWPNDVVVLSQPVDWTIGAYDSERPPFPSLLFDIRNGYVINNE